MIPRAVFDTNIFVAAAFNPRCRSAQLIRDARKGGVTIVWNRGTRGETARTMKKIPPIRAFPLDGLFRPAGRFDGPAPAHAIREVRHVPDRKFAALAAAAGVPLVTRDVDLLAPREAIPAPVFTPEEFERWRSAAAGTAGAT